MNMATILIGLGISAVLAAVLLTILVIRELRGPLAFVASHWRAFSHRVGTVFARLFRVARRELGLDPDADSAEVGAEPEFALERATLRFG